MGQMFTFSRNGWWNIVQVRMLHRPDQCFVCLQIRNVLNNLETRLKVTGTFTRHVGCFSWQRLKFSVSRIPEVSLDTQTRLVSQNKSKNS